MKIVSSKLAKSYYSLNLTNIWNATDTAIICDIREIMYGNDSRADFFLATQQNLRDNAFFWVFFYGLCHVKDQLDGNKMETANFAIFFFFKHIFKKWMETWLFLGSESGFKLPPYPIEEINSLTSVSGTDPNTILASILVWSFPNVIIWTTFIIFFFGSSTASV